MTFINEIVDTWIDDDYVDDEKHKYYNAHIWIHKYFKWSCVVCNEP